MARIASQAVAGYYPTPLDLTPVIAWQIRLVNADSWRTFSVMDPCAGEGRALVDAVDVLAPLREATPSVYTRSQRTASIETYTCEMEDGRAKALKEAMSPFGWKEAEKALHADAFRVQFELGNTQHGVHLLWLNPPYDIDPEAGRLEEAFLRRFSPALSRGGVLVFIVPHGALKASAPTLARDYEEIRAYRFPGDHFHAYRQVVLYARKRDARLVADPALLEEITGWAKNPALLGELPLDADPASAPYAIDLNQGAGGLAKWKAREVDLGALTDAIRPWHRTSKKGSVERVPNILPAALDEVMRRRYTTATPLRPAHAAAAIAAGVFNGSRIEPTDPASGLPPILIKGVFDKEWRKIDEKRNKQGEVTQVVEIQQPKLRTTILRLDTNTFLTLGNGKRQAEEEPEAPADLDAPEPDPRPDLSTFQLGDLLAHYGPSLLDVMKTECPPLFDPARPEQQFSLKPLGRPLFRAQEWAVRATVLLLGGPSLALSARRKKAAFVLGEIGSGKTSVALATAQEVGSQRTLVLCPPHLLKSWEDQARAVLPWARVFVLRSVADVQAFAEATGEAASGHRIAILSRETAKLGHGFSPVPVARTLTNPRTGKVRGNVPYGCPRCGGDLPEKVDFVKKRARCTNAALFPKTASAWLAVDLAIALLGAFPQHHELGQVLPSRALRAWRLGLAHEGPEADARAERAIERLTFGPLPARVWAQLKRRMGDGGQETWQRVREAMVYLGLALGDPEACADMAADLLDTVARERGTEWGRAGVDARSAAHTLLHFASPEGQERAWRTVFSVHDRPSDALEFAERPNYGYHYTPPRHFDAKYAEWSAREAWLRGETSKAPEGGPEGMALNGAARTWGGFTLGSREAWLKLFERLTALGAWGHEPECGEPLYQAETCVAPSSPAGWSVAPADVDPKPGGLARLPLADYITKRYPDAFDFLIADEAHELANEGTAQERAGHKLMNLGLPTILLTGSVMNGYAESLFTNFYAASEVFRTEFRRDESQAFVNRYGYRKRIVEDKDEKGSVVAFGSHSDRIERSVRMAGNAPGLLPLFLLRHLLAMSVTLHKADLQLDLPPCREIAEHLEPAPEQEQQYLKLRDALVTQIRKDMFTPDLAGKLWGAMAELPSYLDRATSDVGNTEEGDYQIRYPETCEVASGHVIASMPGLPPADLLPKEQWLIDRVRAELAEGRRVMVFAWHLALIPRLARLLEQHLLEPVAVLNADRVPTHKREAWIDAQVVGKGRRVMVVNPVTVQTGLNNLTWFSTVVWYQNPGCNPVVYRQANGRIDRIGQKAAETRVYVPVYSRTGQQQLHTLLMNKVGISLATDGLDPESALSAAGAADQDTMAGFSIGRQLFELMARELRGTAPAATPPRPRRSAA
jgi:hypothetical protein